MSFDPNLPVDHSDIIAAELRSQFQGIKTIVDAMSGITAAQVDGVTTVNPGDPATVLASIIDNVLHLSFNIPRGNDGGQGMQGIQGNPGQDGGPGPQGAPFATAVVDGVTTLNPGGNASVSVSFDGTLVHFAFAIPRGADGANGINGTNGSDGQTGAPGEVTTAQLDAAISTAIAGTSNNTNSVSTLDTPFANDPPTLADLEVMRAKMNELILNGRK